MSVTVEIRDPDNNLEGILEVKDSVGFPLSLTYSVADIKNATPTNNRYRSGTFTKTFELAGSQANDQLLQHLYDTNISDPKDIKAKKPCVIKINGTPYLRGNLRVTDVVTSNDVKTYKVTATGNNLVWVDQFNELRLNELNFGSHVFDEATIEASWIASDLDYYYPFTNYGQWEQGDQVTVNDLRPGVFFKSIIDKAFTSIGYAVESNFFDTFQFGETFRLFTGTGFKHPQSVIDANTFTATKTSDQVVNFGAKAFDVPLAGLINPIQFETTDNVIFDVATETYNVGEFGSYNFEVSLNIKAKQQAPDTMFFQTRKNGFVLEEIEIFFINGTSTSGPGFSSVSDLIVKTGDFNLTDTDTITFAYRFEYGSITIAAIADVEITMQIGTFVSNLMDPKFVEGITVTLADQLPDTPIIEYINGLTHCFNLYWKTNVAEQIVTVEPFDDWNDINSISQTGFYKSITDANNFTFDFDKSKSHSITFLRDYKRELRYKYKDDNNDAFLKAINEAQELSFGSYKHTFSDRFQQGEQFSENPTFSFTYYIKDTDISENILNSESPLLARLWGVQKTNGEPPQYDTDFEERILYRNFATQGNAKAKWQGSFITQIPSGLSYGDRSTDLNLKFNGTDGLVAIHYASQLNIIEKGILVNAFFNLIESNIIQLETGDLIREPLYLSDPVELKGYYLINQITDVTPQNPDTYKFELIKFENKEPITIDTGQTEGIGNGPFGETDISSNRLDNNNTPDDIHVFADITMIGTNTIITHVTVFNSETNLIEHVTIPG